MANDSRFVTSKNAKARIGVHAHTLREWADSGLLPSIRLPSGQRLFDVDAFIRKSYKGGDAPTDKSDDRLRLCYCRVSSSGQRDDLERQVEFMRSKYPDHTVVKDVGSGINWKRKQFKAVLEFAMRGRVQEVVVAHRDRLCRFAFELVEWILETNGSRLVVLDQGMASSQHAELSDDLLAIVQVFNCRANGRRKYAKKTTKDLGGGTEEKGRECKRTGGEEGSSDSESETEESRQEGTAETREPETGETESGRMSQDQTTARRGLQRGPQEMVRCR
jgi:putative resolvase